MGLLYVALPPSPADAAVMAPPEKCRELAEVIQQTKAAAAQAEGDASQQEYINQALAQYQALYQNICVP